MFKDEVLNPAVDIKVNSLVHKVALPNIIICGDSRAERQVIPSVLSEKLNGEAINIATSGGSLSTSVNSITSNGLDNNNEIIIMSLSFPNINDNEIPEGGFHLASLVNMSLVEKIKILKMSYFPYLGSLIGNRMLELVSSKFTLDEPRLSNNGFLPCEGVIDTLNSEKDPNEHLWYKNAKINGIKSKLFVQTLDKLSDSNAQIIIFNPPVAPLWYTNFKGTSLDYYEKQYSQFLFELTKKYKNIHFIDFYNHPIPSLTNQMFYNYMHLNKEGASIFSKALADSISKDINPDNYSWMRNRKKLSLE